MSLIQVLTVIGIIGFTLQLHSKTPAPQAEHVFRPGERILDTEGRPVSAHAPGFLRHNGLWYWYGESLIGHHDWTNKLSTGIHVYSSPDLIRWTRLGLALEADPTDPEGVPRKYPIVERAKVIFNPRTGKFVMWMHLDDRPYQLSEAGVAVADRPEGPFKFVRRFRPIPEEPGLFPDKTRQQATKGCPVLDTNLFVDRDGKAYFLYCSEDLSTLHIHELNDDFTDVRRPAVQGKTWARVLPGSMREGPVMFRWRDHVYLLSSGCTGYEPNFLHLARAPSPLGPWESLGDPCIGPESDTGYRSQPAWVLPLPELGEDAFIYIGDRWRVDDLGDTRTIWLPFRMGPNPRLRWLPQWSLGIFEPRPAPAPVENVFGRPWDSRGTQMQPDFVELTWDPSPGADGYTILRNGVEIDFTSETRFKAPLGVPGVPCRFAVRAWNLAGGDSREVHARISPAVVSPFAQTSIVGGEAAAWVQGKPREVCLSDVGWTSSWSTFSRIIRDQAWDGGPLRIGGRAYSKGLFFHAAARVAFDLGGVYSAFQSDAGLFAGLPGNCRFTIRGDGAVLFESKAMTERNEPIAVRVDVRGVHRLELSVEALGRGPAEGRFVWGNPRLLP